MKKLLLSLCIVIATVSMATAQKTADSILENYEKVTGLKSVDLSNADIAMMMDMAITAQGNNVPMKLIMQGSDKFRVEMEVMGQKMTMVRSGDKGWMSAAGQVQPMPKEALDQQADQLNVVSSLKFDKEKYTFNYIGAEGSLDKVEVTLKNDTKNEGPKILYFNGKGLIEKIAGKVEGQDFEMAVGKYKKFGAITIATLMETKIGNNIAVAIVVNDFQFDYPVAAWMFAEPTK